MSYYDIVVFQFVILWFPVLFRSFALMCHVLLFISSFCVNSRSHPVSGHVLFVNWSWCVYSLCAPWCLCQFVLCYPPETVPVSPCAMLLFFVPGFSFLFLFFFFSPELYFALHSLYFVLTFVLLLCFFGIGTSQVLDYMIFGTLVLSKMLFFVPCPSCLSIVAFGSSPICHTWQI